MKSFRNVFGYAVLLAALAAILLYRLSAAPVAAPAAQVSTTP